MRITEKRIRYYDEVISLYFDDHLGRDKIAKIVPVDESTITRWISIFVAENPEMMSKRMKSKVPKRKEDEGKADPPKMSFDSDELKSLRTEMFRLKQELREASLRADLYNEIINVAEKQFNISIRKKAGTKQ